MNYRQQLFRNISGEPYMQKNKKDIRIRSLKQKPKSNNQYSTQAQSPIKKLLEHHNKENLNQDLIINSCESLNLSYSPSSCKKQRAKAIVQRALKPKQVSKKVQQIISIYGEKQDKLPKFKMNGLIKNNYYNPHSPIRRVRC